MSEVEGQVAAPVAKQEQKPIDDGGLAAEMERINEAADRYITERDADETPAAAAPQRQRDEHGRFVPAKGEPKQPAATGPAAATVEVPPVIDDVWKEAAKQAGLSESVISTFKTEDDIQAAIQSHEYTKAREACDYLGIDPVEFTEWQKSRQQGQSVPPPAQATTTPASTQAAAAQALEDLKLEITDDEFGAETATKLRGLVEYVNKLKASLPDAQKIQSELAEMKERDRQRAEAAQVAAFQQKQAARLNTASAATPEVESFFGGKLADVWNAVQANPNHPKAADIMAFNTYFDLAIKKAVGALGNTDKAVELAVRNAWNASPFSKMNGQAKQGTNGNGATNGNGSVVRHGPRRTMIAETVPADGDYESEIKAIGERLGIAWDNNGGNPFASPSA